ncbi:hypothetical protein MLG46_22690, partial [Escherichia coli]|nr:hypothetical protein [Escherichia coli]
VVWRFRGPVYPVLRAQPPDGGDAVMHADNRSGNPHTGFSQPQYIRRQMLAAGSKHAIQCDEHSSGFQSALQQVVSRPAE